MAVSYPFISPDGKQVSFTPSDGGVYIIGMEGGVPKKIADENSFTGTWSPDGSSLVFNARINDNQGATSRQMEIVDLSTGKRSVVPSSQGVGDAQWITQDTLIAYKDSLGTLGVFDIRSGEWTELVSGLPINWALSADRKYLYYTTGGTEPKAMRVRFADHKIEQVTSLSHLRRVTDPIDEGTQISVAPDGSPVFTRDIGSQEIYALTVKWP
jgi:Tol biopolymer transport system component